MKVSLCNSAGELDARLVEPPAGQDVPDESAVAEAAIALILETGSLHDGDSILITEVD
jgi:hypothetical protein